MLLSVLAGVLAFVPRAASGAPTPSALHWSACAGVKNVQCTFISVPVDPNDANGAMLRLRIGRVPAVNASRKKGVLLFPPGGPGAGISDMFAGNRAANHVDDFARQYDVVTFDPRGIGESSPIRCSPQALPRVSAPVDEPPSQAQFTAITAANAAFFKTCFALTGPLMSHLSAADTAADIERIRQAVAPNAGLIAYAGSFGSEYAEAYLDLYGNHIKALVLDAVVDHSVDLQTFMERNVLSVQDAFNQFARWCARDRACAVHGKNLTKVYAAVRVKAPLTRTLVAQLLAGGSDPEFGWPFIARLFAQVQAGDMSGVDAMNRAVSIAGTEKDPQIRVGRAGLFSGVLCADYGPQNDYVAFHTAAVAIERRAPLFAWKFWDAAPKAHASAGVLDCAGWPEPATYPPHRLHVGLHPDVMVANPTHDPATPLVNALSVWMQIPDARLLIADVDGHQSLILSKCAYAAMVRFMNAPSSLSSTTICPN